MSAHMEVATRIQRLLPAVINKIAAGEVIERPASVVKELLENSIDALATRIEVDVVQGGTELIRVVDNGEGIHADDVELAVTAHATSKIADADDLFHVYTLGFRGEALASIAEVSKFRIRSRAQRTADSQSVPELDRPDARTDWKSVLPDVEIGGVELEVEGGVAGEARPCGCPAGTQVEVRQLFFNTPVRRKFLKAAATEFAHVAEQFTRIALAHPRLYLVLRHNERTVYELPATGQLSERLETFFGSELARHLIPVEAEQGDARLWGCVAHPGQSKATRKGQYLFLNGRWIQDRSLQHALSEAYRGLLMVGRQPIAFLFLEAPAEEVDVNVHPTKCEVRFRDPQRFYRLLLSTLRSKFLTLDLHSALNVPPGGAISRDKPVDPERQLQVQQELVTWAKEQLANWQPKDDLSDLEAKLAECELDDGTRPRAAPDGDETAASLPPVPSPAATDAFAPAVPPAPIIHAATPDATSRPASPSAELRAMQVHDCYLVVETGDGLIVIDQHALHERILYEHFRRRVLAGNVEVQKLLMPVTVELTAREAGLLLDRADMLAELGLSVAPFGGQTVALDAYPTLLARADPADLLRSVVEHLETSSQDVSRRDLLDSLLHMMACKAAIKAGQRLAPEEIASLIAQRHLVDDHHHCPHGRPTALTLSRAELDRQFGRLG